MEPESFLYNSCALTLQYIHILGIHGHDEVFFFSSRQPGILEGEVVSHRQPAYIRSTPFIPTYQ